jgi:NADPH:quinone reductase-like Zn-dependent oxidoreductase
MLPNSYKKLVVVKATENLREACEVQDVPLELPAADEILVKTHFAGVNASDYLMAQGRYLMPTPPPYDMGGESVGEVVAVGDSVDNFKVGDAVLALAGGYRDYFTVKASRAIPVPKASPEAVSLAVSGLTALLALEKTGEMTSGETVLVTAAAGGTGSFAVQIAKAAGNTVIGTCSSDEKAEFLRSIGCDRAINYKKESLKDVLKTEFPRGVDIVFETVGGETFDTALKALATHGRMIVIGSMSEYETGPQNVTAPRIGYAILRKSASIRAFWLMHFLKDVVPTMKRLLDMAEAGKLLLTVDDTNFKGTNGVFEALDYMYSGKNIGKVVVDFR